MEVTQRSQMVLQQIVEEKTAENSTVSPRRLYKNNDIACNYCNKNHYIRLNNFLEFHFLPRGNLARQQCCDFRVPVVTLT